MRESARRRQADTSRILVGYWRESTEPEPNQHAVYGILSRDGTLRFKVVSETRDGRPIQCKSLLSPGDSWIIHDEVVLEPHLRHLNRLEMKEYCRVRQHHIDQGEEGQDMAANILNSVELAKQIAEASYSRERPRNLRWAREKCADERRARRKLKKRLISEAAQLEEEHVTAVAGPDAEAKPDVEAKTEAAEIQVNVSQLRTEDARVQDPMVRSSSFTAIRPAHSTPPVPVRESETAPPQPSAHVHVHAHAPAPPPALTSGRRDWHSVIQPHMRTVSPPIAAAPPPPPPPPPPLPPPPPRASAPPPPPTMAPPAALPTARGSKSYGGIRYDWKDTGLFTQKYVSRGCIITIDDEDYVEYRVLTKPAFI